MCRTDISRNSQSPAAKKSTASNDAHIQAAIGFAAIVGLIFLDQGADGVDPRSGGWVKFFNGNGGNIHALWPYGWIITLHALNTAQGASAGNWLGSLVGNFIATFAPAIVNGFFFNGASITAEATNANIALAGAAWYITNHAPFGVDVWGQIKDVAGPALTQVLNLATLSYGLTQALGAAGSFGPIALDISSWSVIFAIGYQCFKAAVVATAGNYVPLDKGFSFDGFDEDSDRAFVSAAYMAVVAGFGITQLNVVSEFFQAGSAGSADFVVFANILIVIITGSGACPAIPNPVPMIQEKLYEFTGLRA